VWFLFIFKGGLVRVESLVRVQWSAVALLAKLAAPVAFLGGVMLLLTVSFRNFRHVQSGVGLWARNSAVWVAGLLLTTVLASAAYHRAWEVAMPFEPAAGPARLSGDVQPMMARYYRSGWLLVLLPDGRLWAMREYATEPYSGEWTGNESGWRVIPIKKPHGEFIGSNWVSMAMSQYDVAGVQSDGTLWRISWWETDDENGQPVPAVAGDWYRKGQTLRQTPMVVTRIGDDSDWTMVVAGAAHFLALKRDGTIWGWGENSSGQLGDGLPKEVRAPMQIGEDSDWEFISTSVAGSVAVKRDKSVWKWGGAYPITGSGIGRGYIGGTMRQIATLPAKASNIESTSYSDVFICEDGSGWGLGQLRGNFLGSKNSFPMLTQLTRLWEGERWTEVQIEGHPYIGGIREDGTLWLQVANRSFHAASPDPEPLGERNDWIGLRTGYGPVYALARDGTLCRFGDEIYSEQPLFAPTRRVTWGVNVLDSVKP
ncbi:MAG TPA: hypothetical protein PKA41_10860, partial [Verrucomicrobiota bacterium]|nr:hypothetical protein [Verrucomicrobiota bacterium]